MRHGAFAGWLYADLMLALFVVFLAATTGTPVVHGHPQPPPPTPTPSPTPPCTTAVALQKHELSLPAGQAADGLPGDDRLLAAFAPFSGQVAGILLTFTHSTNADDGVALSARVNDRLRHLYPLLFTGRTIMENFFSQDSGASHHGSVDFNLYLLSQTCSP